MCFAGIKITSTNFTMKKSISLRREDKKIFIVRENVELDIISFHQFGIELQEMLKQGTDWLVIYDASKITIDMPGEVKLAMVEWLKDNETLLKNNVFSGVIIVPSLIAQMVVKAVFSIKKPSADYKVFSNRKNAYEWIAQQEVLIDK